MFQPDDDDPRVVLDLAPDAGWVAEAVPGRGTSRREPDGRAAGRAWRWPAEAWLERLLLGLGPQATVVEAPDRAAGRGRRASGRILDRYR